jgi:putative ABC transport system permease protein
MIKYILQNIRKRKVRSLLTVLGIAVCIQMFTIISSIIDYTISDLEGELTKYAGQMYVKNKSTASTTGETFPPMNSSILQSSGDQILSDFEGEIQGDLSTPVIFNMIAGPAGPNMPPQALAVGVNPGKEQAYTGKGIEMQGGSLSLNKDGKHVVLGASAATFFEVNKVGDSILLAGDTYVVSGILKKNNRVVDPLILLSIENAQKTFSLKETYSTVLITVKKLADIDSLSKDIESQNSKLEVMTQEGIADNINSSLAGTKMFMTTILVTVIGVAVIVILIVMTLAIMERTKEIGVLRAIGATKKNIMFSILSESLLMSFIGGSIGVSLGYLVLLWVFQAPDFFTLQIAYLGVGMSILIGILSSIYPSYRAIKILPQEALRYE